MPNSAAEGGALLPPLLATGTEVAVADAAKRVAAASFTTHGRRIIAMPGSL